MHNEAKPQMKAGGILRPLRQCEADAASVPRISERSLVHTGRGATTINFRGLRMQVFHELRAGRFRFYHAAVEDSLATVVDFWRRGMLGSAFILRPITEQAVGEEVIGGSGKTIAVFGLTAADAPVSAQDAHKEFREKLTEVIRKSQP